MRSAVLVPTPSLQTLNLLSALRHAFQFARPFNLYGILQAAKKTHIFSPGPWTLDAVPPHLVYLSSRLYTGLPVHAPGRPPLRLISLSVCGLAAGSCLNKKRKKERQKQTGFAFCLLPFAWRPDLYLSDSLRSHASPGRFPRVSHLFSSSTPLTK